jgi:hypothetical protein
VTLEPIGDIASVTLSETNTWETAADWDNAVSEDGVVHEVTANTDHDDDTVIKMGYRYDFRLISPTPNAAWPQHEDSGPTAHDLAGTHDGTPTGGTGLGNTGILGTTSYEYEPTGGTDADVEISASGDIRYDGLGDSFTSVQWVYTNGFDTGSWNHLMAYGGDGNDVFGVKSGRNTGAWSLYLETGGDSVGHVESDTDPTIGAWEFVVVTYDGSEAELYVDAVNEYTWGGGSGSLSSTSEDWRLANRGEKNEALDGRLTESRLYGTDLTAAQVQTLYDVVDKESTLTTATKTFSSPSQPNVSDLEYTQNGETIVLDVIGSPGTASEEVVSQNVDGSASYSLTWSNSHTDFRVQPRLSTSTPTTTPTISSVTLRT